MIPILRALKDRLLNEPAFFLSTAAAVGVLVAEYVELPAWVGAAAVVVAGIATRSVVDGPLTVRSKERRRRVSRAARARAGEAGMGLIEALVAVFLILVILIVLLRVA